jgi:porin
MLIQAGARTLMRWAGAGALGLAMLAGGPANAADAGSPVTFEAIYRLDVLGPVQGGVKRRGSVLDDLGLVADVDLGQVIGWSGATLHGYLLSNNGEAPNDDAGTLQGVDNIEVTRQGLRLYELWVQAPLGEKTTVLAGLYDLNSEFYANDAAGLLIGPAFGIGSELAATGPNGPSIFPSTALAVRLNHDFSAGYVRAAMVNARAGVPGDPDGVDLHFGDGALFIAEAGTTGRTSVSIGYWRYGARQDDILDVTPGGAPAQRTAQGAYLLGERVLVDGGEAGRTMRGFFRVGVSDGDTSPFKGGWQAGVLIDRALPGRPESQVSLGLQQGVLSSKMKAVTAAGGVDPASAESGLELALSDRVAPRLTLQPDLQVIFGAGGDAAADTEVVIGLRLTVDLTP